MCSTAVTNLHEEGVSLEVIAKISGHVDDAVTREHYLAVTAERTRREFEVLAERLRQGRSDPQSDPKAPQGHVEGGGAAKK
jgi:hypothetical protein